MKKAQRLLFCCPCTRSRSSAKSQPSCVSLCMVFYLFYSQHWKLSVPRRSSLVILPQPFLCRENPVLGGFDERGSCRVEAPRSQQRLKVVVTRGKLVGAWGWVEGEGHTYYPILRMTYVALRVFCFPDVTSPWICSQLLGGGDLVSSFYSQGHV